MVLKFIPVKSNEEIQYIASVAGEIWREYWPQLIGFEQVDYMLEKYQSVKAISNDIQKNGYEYWQLVKGEKVVGYTGGRVEVDSNRFFISKIYLYAPERGKGYASEVLRFYEKLGRSRGLCILYLTVNKYNELATRAYLAKGFIIAESVVTDIGGGFVMDDYIMEKGIMPDAS